MGHINNMTSLINKIEGRLGLKPIHLPDEVKKEKWPNDIIIPDSLVTYSRYFPRQMKYVVDPNIHPRRDGYFILDELQISPDAEILGVKDISWEDFAEDSLTYQQNMGLGVYDFVANGFGVTDVGLLQMRADHMSLFNNGIFIDFEPPNMIRVKSATGADLSRAVGRFRILLLLKHRSDLTTISATQMETFESLCQADIALYLYRYLEYYDGLESVFGNQVDLKLDRLRDEASKRDDVINSIKEGYVTAANKNQPYMLTI